MRFSRICISIEYHCRKWLGCKSWKGGNLYRQYIIQSSSKVENNAWTFGSFFLAVQSLEFWLVSSKLDPFEKKHYKKHAKKFVKWEAKYLHS